MRYIDFTAISQEYKNEILLQVLSHDYIIEQIEERISFLLNELESTSLTFCFKEYYHMVFSCYKLLHFIDMHSVDLIAQEPLKNSDIKEFLKQVDKRMDLVLDKMKNVHGSI